MYCNPEDGYLRKREVSKAAVMLFTSTIVWSVEAADRYISDGVTDPSAASLPLSLSLDPSLTIWTSSGLRPKRIPDKEGIDMPWEHNVNNQPHLAQHIIVDRMGQLYNTNEGIEIRIGFGRPSRCKFRSTQRTFMMLPLRSCMRGE